MQGTNKIEEKHVTLGDIYEFFKTGIKDEKALKVGIEIERLPISTKDFKMTDYESSNGIYDLLRNFAKMYGWEYITDDYNIIGLKKDNDTITLEPGSQVELSLEPEKNIQDIKLKIEDFNKKLSPMLKNSGIQLLQYGISPVSTYKYINLIPKKRYHIMADYLWGILSDVMMRETAGIQACFDFSSEEDAIRKFRIANIISPIATAMFANSPVRGGVDTGYKTFRGLSWLNTDNERCHFMSKKLFNKKYMYSFKNYIDEVIKTPMIYIVRNEKTINILGKIDFEQFMKEGYEGYTATLEDFKLHANLYFPDVRLRNFIEIRNHDCANHGMQYSVLALYKGIMYNKKALDSVEKLMSKFTYENIMEFRYDVPRVALAGKIGKYHASDIANELLCISLQSLKENNQNEETFLDAILELTPHGLSPADVIMKQWNGSWNKDISKLIKYLNN